MKNNTANVILAQLGGARFVAMTGAKNLLDIGNGLACRVGRGATNGANHFQVELRADDTYTVRFSKIAQRGLRVGVVSEHEMVYANQLRALFTSQTGMETSL